MKISAFLTAFSFILVTISLSTSACDSESFRLYDNGVMNTNQGMLQICNEYSQWVGVCDYQWRQEFSVSVCTELGHSNPTPLTKVNSGYWNTLGYIAHYYSLYSSPPSCLRNGTFIDCLANSSAYLTSSYYRTYYCNPNRDTVYIQCNFTVGTCTPNDIRLYNSTAANNNTGMLQLCSSKGVWTAVCDYAWRCNHAQVACKQLGYSNPKVVYTYNAGPWPIFGFGPYSYCSSSFSNLSFCASYSSYYRERPGYCNPLRDTVRLGCVHKEQNNGENCTVNYQLRLVNGSQTNEYIEGRAEICFNGLWTPICQYAYVNSLTGGTLCNSLSNSNILKDFSKIYNDNRYGVSLNTNAIRRMYCRNAYDSVRSCSITLSSSYSPCSSYTCPGSLGLKCYVRGNCNEGQARLVNGTLEREGKLEVCYNGIWGNVCPYNFQKSAAHIACKEAGYTDVMGAIIYTNGQYGPGNGLYVYGNVNCYGHEKLLSQCSKSVYPNFTCYANTGVGLLCKDNCTQGQVKLVGGRHAYEGYVQVCLDNIWTLVAKNGWEDEDAQIVCKQLNVKNHLAGVSVNDTSIYGPKPKRAVRLSNVYCLGREDRLEDCIHHTIELNDGRNYSGNVAAVNCNVKIQPPSTTIGLTASNEGQSLNKSEASVLGTGVGLLVLAITILVIGIIVMAFIIMRIKKLSLSREGRNSDRQQMSSLREENYKEDSHYGNSVGTISVKPININDGDEQILS